MSNIELELKLEDVLIKPTEQKIDDLVRMVFNQYEEIKKQGKILYGNGDVGLCEQARANKTKIICLWTVFTTVAGIFGTLILTHILK
jgi:hypothetical protein